MRWRGAGIYAPGFKLLLYGFERASSLRAHAHYIRNALRDAVEHAVVVAGVVTKPLT